MNIRDMQKAIYQNKIDHQFNVTNIEKEFLSLYGEVAEAFDAYRKNKMWGRIGRCSHLPSRFSGDLID